MKYENFVEQVRERIRDFLPEKFADTNVEINQVITNNDCTLDGLFIHTEESNIVMLISQQFWIMTALRTKLCANSLTAKTTISSLRISHTQRWKI